VAFAGGRPIITAYEETTMSRRRIARPKNPQPSWISFDHQCTFYGLDPVPQRRALSRDPAFTGALVKGVVPEDEFFEEHTQWLLRADRLEAWFLTLDPNTVRRGRRPLLRRIQARIRSRGVTEAR
jgi:hypothetical protein